MLVVGAERVADFLNVLCPNAWLLTFHPLVLEVDKIDVSAWNHINDLEFFFVVVEIEVRVVLQLASWTGFVGCLAVLALAVFGIEHKVREAFFSHCLPAVIDGHWIVIFVVLNIPNVPFSTDLTFADQGVVIRVGHVDVKKVVCRRVVAARCLQMVFQLAN